MFEKTSTQPQMAVLSRNRPQKSPYFKSRNCSNFARIIWTPLAGIFLGYFNTPLEHTPKPLPTGYKGISFIVGKGDCLGRALRVYCSVLGYLLSKKKQVILDGNLLPTTSRIEVCVFDTAKKNHHLRPLLSRLYGGGCWNLPLLLQGARVSFGRWRLDVTTLVTKKRCCNFSMVGIRIY